jgi:hypothetical protein
MILVERMVDVDISSAAMMGAYARRATVWCDSLIVRSAARHGRASPSSAARPNAMSEAPSLHAKRGIETMLLGLVPMSEAIDGLSAVRFREGIAAVDMRRPLAFRCL